MVTNVGLKMDRGRNPHTCVLVSSFEDASFIWASIAGKKAGMGLKNDILPH